MNMDDEEGGAQISKLLLPIDFSIIPGFPTLIMVPIYQVTFQSFMVMKMMIQLDYTSWLFLNFWLTLTLFMRIS